MSGFPQKKPEPSEPIQLHGRAMDNLSFIRETMARSTCFTAVSGWGVMGMGVIALAGAGVASLRLSQEWWLGTWVLVAISACGVGVGAMMLKARRSGAPILAGPGRKFLLSFAPAITAGCVMGEIFYRMELDALFPGMWLMLYGVGVVTGGAYSVRVIPLIGACFMILGTITFLLPNPQDIVFATFERADLMLSAGFGGLHILMGAVIACKHGG